MQAINHAATALILKRRFPSAPLWGLIAATEAVEYLWVGLNLLDIERTVVAEPMHSVADVHLTHMPFSHSLLTSGVLALVVGLVVFWRGGTRRTALAVALALATASHIILDLFVHAPDIVRAPFGDGVGYGTGLYAAFPLLALGLETLWGVYCWWIYRGSRALLAVMLLLNLTAIPIYSASLNIGESVLAGHENIFALVILAQMVVTSVLVWLFARRTEQTGGVERNATRYARV